MLDLISAFLAAIRVFFRSRVVTSLEVLALRQQVAVLKRKRPRPPLNRLDRFFWTTLRNIWPRWSDALVIVKPETVVGWHRAGFRLYWRWRSRPLYGRPKLSEEIRILIHRMAAENSDWGAPKIHGELLKLGIDVSERTVGRYLRRLRRRGDPAKRWLAFLANHREVIVAFDFFTVPTLTFQLLYCFFVIEHGRRGLLHFNIIRHPNGLCNSCGKHSPRLVRIVMPSNWLPHRFNRESCGGTLVVEARPQKVPAPRIEGRLQRNMLMDRETEMWRAALATYRYPVDLRDYKFVAAHKGWFGITTAPGSRDDTIAFESRFRENAPTGLDPWFEVIFWKLASQKLIRNGTTHSMAMGLRGSTTAEQLWRACKDYTQAGSRAESRTCFEVLHRLFNLTTRSIATVATFPAFLDPDRFPMVDTRIAKWVGRTMDAHNRVDPF